MTIKELSEQYNIAETTIYKNFSKVQEKLQKDNINITRVKVDGEYDYQIAPLYDNKIGEEGFLDYEILQEKKGLICGIIFALSAYDSKGYGGNINRFLEECLEIPASTYNKNQLKEALQILQDNGYILYKTKKNDIVVGLTEKTRQDLAFKVSFLNDCREMAKKADIKSYITVFKIFVAMFILLDLYGTETTITYKEISELICTSAKTIGGVFKKLNKDDIVRLGRLEYEINEESGTIKCRGRKIDINEFIVSKPIRVLRKLTDAAQ